MWILCVLPFHLLDRYIRNTLHLVFVIIDHLTFAHARKDTIVNCDLSVALFSKRLFPLITTRYKYLIVYTYLIIA